MNMATTGHAQTDGQTERVNRVLEDLLRPYTSNWQDDWDGEKLALAEFAYNSARHTATGVSPFECVYGYIPHTPASLLTAPATSDGVPSLAPSRIRLERDADAFVLRMRALLLAVRDRLEEGKDRMAARANKGRRDVSYRIGDRVLLSAKHIDFNTADGRKQTRKFLPRFGGPFTITDVVSPVAYRLRLPPQIRMHSVFHVSWLQPYKDPRAAFPGRVSRVPPTILADGTAGGQVEKILQRKVIRGVEKFLVLWLGEPVSDATWQTRADLEGCPEVIEEFEEEQRKGVVGYLGEGGRPVDLGVVDDEDEGRLGIFVKGTDEDGLCLFDGHF